MAIPSPVGCATTSMNLSFNIKKYWSGIAYGDSVIVVVSNNNSSTSAYSQDNGISWQNTNMPFNNDWSSVAFVGNNIGFIAVTSSLSGTTAFSNGVQDNWLYFNQMRAYNWSKVIFDNDRSQIVATSYQKGAGSTGSNEVAIFKLDDGDWTYRIIPITAQWFGLTNKAGIYVAVSYEGIFARSTDGGDTWQTGALPAAGMYRTIAGNDDGSILVATGDSGICAVSNDYGLSWQGFSRNSSNAVLALAYGNGYFLAKSGNGLERSIDGRTWETIVDKTDFTPSVDIVYAQGNFYATNYSAQSINTPDGIKYICQSAPSPTPSPSPSPSPSPTPVCIEIGYTFSILQASTNTATVLGTNGVTFKVGETLTISNIPATPYFANVNGSYLIERITSPEDSVFGLQDNTMILKCVSSGCFDGWSSNSSMSVPVVSGMLASSSGGAELETDITSGNPPYYFIFVKTCVAFSPTPTPTPSPTPTPFVSIVKNFGVRCAISGDGNTMVAVQSNLDRDTVFVYKYVDRAWQLYQELEHSNEFKNFYYMSCAIDNTGKRIIVGYTHTEDFTNPNDRTCCLYVYTLADTAPLLYVTEAVLNPGIVVTSLSAYGTSCSISEAGDRILVSLPTMPLPRPDGSADRAGVLYYYKRTGSSWTLYSQVRVREPQENDLLGNETSCVMSSRTAIGLGGLSDRNLVAVFDLTAPSVIAPDGLTAGDKFGDSVELSKDGLTAAISANGHLQKSGTVYIYNRSETDVFYNYTAITADDQSSNDGFGTSLVMNETANLLIIGADNADEKGAVYVFNGSNLAWSLKSKLPTPTSYSNKFGHSVSLSRDGTYLYVGAPNDSPAGAIYVYKLFNNTFSSLSRIGPSDGTNISNMSFGSSMTSITSLNTSFNRTLFIGAPNRSGHDGAVYVYNQTNDTITEDSRITHPFVQKGTSFGTAVLTSTDGNTLFISAPNQDTQLGAVFVYQYDQTRQSYSYSYSLMPNLPGYFGGKLSVSENNTYLYVSASFTDIKNKNNAGAIYVYRLEKSQNVSKYTLCNIIVSNLQSIDERFGSDMSSSSDGSELLVGASGVSNSRGISYVFRQSVFNAERIINTNGPLTGEFGSQIVSDDDVYRLLVSAPNESINGRVYYYKRTASVWSRVQQILPAILSSVNDSAFGCALDADKFLLSMVAGYKKYSGEYLNGGVAIVYVNVDDIWTPAYHLRPDDPCVNNYFGASVAMSGDSNMIAVGATGSLNEYGSPVGAIYLFYADNTYPQIARFSPSDLTLNSEFGVSCSLNRDGTRLIVGAPNQDLNGLAGAGAIYTYEIMGGVWTPKQKILSGLTPIEHIYHPSRFGSTVKIGANGIIAVVSSMATIKDVVMAGDIFIYRSDSLNNLILEAHITPPTELFVFNDSSLRFGSSVSISEDENTILIGAPGDVNGGSIIRYDYINNIWIPTAKYVGNVADDMGLGISSIISADKKVIIGGASEAGVAGSMIAYTAD